MKPNLRHSIQQLLACTDFNSRISQSRHMISILNKSVGNFGKVETTLRANLIDRIKTCALHPNSNQRFVLFKLADFYDQTYLFKREIPFAA